VGGLVRAGDTRLFVETRGVGPSVIVLHGGPGADHTQLLEPLLPLTSDFTLHFVDQRAQGRSDRAPKKTWTIHHAARDVSAVAAALELPAYAVLGHSYGALVCLQHAVSFPGAAVASVVSHGVPSPRWYRLAEELDRFDPPELRDQVRRAWDELGSTTDPGRMTELIALQAPFHFKDPFNPAIAELNRRMLAEMIHTPEVNRHMSAADFRDFDVEASLGLIAQPVLVLSGRGERVCPVEAAEHMAAHVPGAELAIFEDSGHVSYVEEPDRYVAVVRDFLRRNLPG
jgi:proline-specific peptidase